MYASSSEGDREYVRLLLEYGYKKDSAGVDNKKEYQYFLRAKKEHIKDSIGRSPQGYLGFVNLINQLASAGSILKSKTQNHLYILKTWNLFNPKTALQIEQKNFF